MNRGDCYEISDQGRSCALGDGSVNVIGKKKVATASRIKKKKKDIISNIQFTATSPSQSSRLSWSMLPLPPYLHTQATPFKLIFPN